MELGDFGAILLFAGILLIPLGAICITLKTLWRIGQGQLFLNAWWVWLAWLGSTIFTYLAVVVFFSQLGTHWNLSEFWWITICLSSVFVSNILAVGITLNLTARKSNRELHLLREEKPPKIGWSTVFEASLITTMAAIASLVVLAVLASGVGAIYDQYYPKTKTDFAIYDI